MGSLISYFRQPLLCRICKKKLYDIVINDNLCITCHYSTRSVEEYENISQFRWQLSFQPFYWMFY